MSVSWGTSVATQVSVFLKTTVNVGIVGVPICLDLNGRRPVRAAAASTGRVFALNTAQNSAVLRVK